MKNARQDRVRAVLAEAGVQVSDDVIKQVVQAVVKTSPVEYEKGDFVCVYEGMGEISYGEVQGMEGHNYRVRGYNAREEKYENYVGTVSPGDMRGIATKADALSYEIERSKPYDGRPART